MRKRIAIMLIMLVIVIGTYAYFSDWKEPTQKTIITNNNGEVIEPLSGENDNLGHWDNLFLEYKIGDVIKAIIDGIK